MPIRNHQWAERRSVTPSIIYSLGCSDVYKNSHSDTVGCVANAHLQGLWFEPELGLVSVFSFVCSPHVRSCTKLNTEFIFVHLHGSFLCEQYIWVNIYEHCTISLLHLWNAGRNLKLLRKRLPVSVNASGSVSMTGKQLWCLHNDGIQISNPVWVNT